MRATSMNQNCEANFYLNGMRTLRRSKDCDSSKDVLKINECLSGTIYGISVHTNTTPRSDCFPF